MERFKSVLTIIVVYGGIIGGLVWIVGMAGTSPPDICELQTIPHETEHVDDPDRYLGDNLIDPHGENGERKVCKDPDGIVTVDEVVTSPVAEIIHTGSKEPEPVYEPYIEPDYGEGAICNDGWRSYSTGRGTCSWHGGVAYYL